MPHTTSTIRSPQRQTRRRVWTLDEVRALGTVTDIETAASVLTLGRTKAYELARDGQFPVRLTRAGTRYLVPVAGLLRLLDAEPHRH